MTSIALSDAQNDLLRHIEELPIHRWYGLELVALDREEARMRLPLRPDFLHPGGRFNGAILNHLLDVPTHICLIPHLQPHTNATTLSLAVEHLEGVRPGARQIELIAKPVRVGRRVALVDASAFVDRDCVARLHATKLIFDMPT